MSQKAPALLLINISWSNIFQHLIFFLSLVKIKKDALRGNAKGNGDYPYHLKLHSNVPDIYFASSRNISKFSLGEEKWFQSDTWNVPLSFELVSSIPFTVSCSLYQPLHLSPSCFPLGCIPHSLRLSTQLVFPKCFQSACNSQGYVNNFQIKSFLGIFCPCAKAELTG